jgi:Thiamine pyrophosphate enzyme, C-terminal TPP binding domain
MMNSQELETAARLGLNIVVLILQDNAYGMIRWKQEVDGFPDFGMTFGNPDFMPTPRPTVSWAARWRVPMVWCRRSKRLCRRRGPARHRADRLCGEHASPGRRVARTCTKKTVSTRDCFRSIAQLDREDATALDRKIDVGRSLFADLVPALRNRKGRASLAVRDTSILREAALSGRACQPRSWMRWRHPGRPAAQLKCAPSSRFTWLHHT